MTVVKVGEQVRIGGDVNALVIAVMIETKELVSYKVVWWSGRERKVEWVSAMEISTTATNSSMMQIGFK